MEIYCWRSNLLPKLKHSPEPQEVILRQSHLACCSHLTSKLYTTSASQNCNTTRIGEANGVDGPRWHGNGLRDLVLQAYGGCIQ